MSSLHVWQSVETQTTAGQLLKHVACIIDMWIHISEWSLNQDAGTQVFGRFHWKKNKKNTMPRLLISQDVGKMVFGRFPWIFIFDTRNEAHKQYSLLDTIFNYIFYLGPPGKYLYLSPKNPLHVGRRSRPTCSRFSWLFYRYFPGGPR